MTQDIGQELVKLAAHVEALDGNPVQERDAEQALAFLQRYLKHPKSNRTVDIVVLRVTPDCVSGRANFHVLMIRRKNDPFKGCLALPGGFIDPGEDIPDAAVRELKEETNLEISVEDLEHVGAYGKPGRDPRGPTTSIAFVVVLNCEHTLEAKAGDDAASIEWIDIKEFSQARNEARVAFDHCQIILDAYQIA